MAADQLSKKNPDGTAFGQSTADLIAFHGLTPISQRVSATLTSTHSLFTVTPLSYVAGASESVRFEAVVSALTEIRACLVAYGLHKGGA